MADLQHRPNFQHRSDKLTGERGTGPSRSQILALVTLLPVSATLLFLAGITFAGTLIGLAVATPVFIIFSPVLVPAALTIGLAVMGFLTSGAFGVTALSSLSWMANYVRRMRGSFGDQMDQGKRRAQEGMGYMGQKVKETGQALQGKAQAQGQHQDVGSK